MCIPIGMKASDAGGPEARAGTQGLVSLPGPRQPGAPRTVQGPGGRRLLREPGAGAQGRPPTETWDRPRRAPLQDPGSTCPHGGPESRSPRESLVRDTLGSGLTLPSQIVELNFLVRVFWHILPRSQEYFRPRVAAVRKQTVTPGAVLVTGNQWWWACRPHVSSAQTGHSSTVTAPRSQLLGPHPLGHSSTGHSSTTTFP